MNDSEEVKGVGEGERLDSNGGSGDAKVKTVETTLEAIEECIDQLNLSFDLDELKVLENDYATPAEIEALKETLGPTVPARLYGLANSVHYGREGSGHISRFTELITRLGTDLIRSFAIFIAFLEFADDHDMKVVMARNFATSKIAEAIGVKMKVPAANKNMAILGGLFMEIGRLIIMLYAQKEGIKFKEKFYNKFQAKIGVLVIEKFGLPPPLKEMIKHPHFTFEGKDDFSSSAILDMAHNVVLESFDKHGKLIVQSTMPDPEGILYRTTIGSEIMTQFIAMGIGEYISVISAELTEVEQRVFDKALSK